MGRHRLTMFNRGRAYRPGDNGRDDAAVFLSEIRSSAGAPIGYRPPIDGPGPLVPTAQLAAVVPSTALVLAVGDPTRIPLDLAAEAVGVELSRDSDPNIRRI